MEKPKEVTLALDGLLKDLSPKVPDGIRNQAIMNATIETENAFHFEMEKKQNEENNQREWLLYFHSIKERDFFLKVLQAIVIFPRKALKSSNKNISERILQKAIGAAIEETERHEFCQIKEEEDYICVRTMQASKLFKDILNLVASKR